jgi:hypothetical protein
MFLYLYQIFFKVALYPLCSRPLVYPCVKVYTCDNDQIYAHNTRLERCNLYQSTHSFHRQLVQRQFWLSIQFCAGACHQSSKVLNVHAPSLQKQPLFSQSLPQKILTDVYIKLHYLVFTFLEFTTLASLANQPQNCRTRSLYLCSPVQDGPVIIPNTRFALHRFLCLTGLQAF